MRVLEHGTRGIHMITSRKLLPRWHYWWCHMWPWLMVTSHWLCHKWTKVLIVDRFVEFVDLWPCDGKHRMTSKWDQSTVLPFYLTLIFTCSFTLSFTLLDLGSVSALILHRYNQYFMFNSISLGHDVYNIIVFIVILTVFSLILGPLWCRLVLPGYD